MSLEIRQHQPGSAAQTVSATNEQILGEIRDFCRETRTAELTFGRRVVNDGKLVSRLRDGARITTGTLDKVRTYLSVSRPAPRGPARGRRADQPRPRRAASRSRTRRPPASASSTTGRNICCSSRPAARRPRSPTASRSNSATFIPRRRRCACSTPASATARCCRGSCGRCTPAFRPCRSTSSARRSATKTCG